METSVQHRSWGFARLGRRALVCFALGAAVWIAVVVVANKSVLIYNFHRGVSEQISAATPSCIALTLEDTRRNMEEYGQPDSPNLTRAEIQTRQACVREQGAWFSSSWNAWRADVIALLDAMGPLVATALVPPIVFAVVSAAGIFARLWLVRQRASSRSAIPYLVAGLVIGSLCLWQALTGQLSAKDFAVLAFPLIGTFLGATLAFRLEQERESSRLEAARKEALDRALLVIAVQWNEIRGLLNSTAPYRDEFSRAFLLPAFQPPEVFDHRQRIDELTFLLRSPNPQISLTIALEQTRFDQCVYAVRLRNMFYVNEVQPVMALHFKQGQLVSSKEFKNAIGERLYEGAVNNSKRMIELLTASDESLQEAMHDLRDLALKLYPGHSFMKIEPIQAVAV